MDLCIFTALRKVNRVLFRHYQSVLAPSGLSIVQLSVLRALERNGPMTLSRLADNLVMERTSLYRTIKPLSEQNAIAVSHSGAGKANIATLTQEGSDTVERVMPYWEAAQSKILTEINQDALDGLQQFLTAMPDIINIGKETPND